MATLSLYIFNLLPLPLLDGLQFLITFVEMAWGQDNGVMNEYDLEALAVSRDQRTRSTGGNRWSFQLANVVPKVTIVLLAGCLVLETINTIL
jgi:S2P endopeptidase